MKTLEVTQATAPVTTYLEDVESSQQPVIFTVAGRPVAALVPLSNTDLETAILSTHPRFLALIERSRSRQAAEGGLSPTEVRRQLGL